MEVITGNVHTHEDFIDPYQQLVFHMRARGKLMPLLHCCFVYSCWFTTAESRLLTCFINGNFQVTFKGAP